MPGYYPPYRNSGRPGGRVHNFAEVAEANIPRSKFDRPSGLSTSFDAGLLIPIFVEEVIPGDTHSLSMSSFVRMATPVFPVFDNITVDYFFFFVPFRLVWDNFQKFMGEQVNPGDSTSFLVPQFTPYVPAELSISDYMGIPVGNPAMAAITHNSLAMRAYNKIWNEWFRDENLQNSIVVDVDDGPDAIADYVLKRRGKRKDYFTACLPFAQKGTPVLLPLGSTAPVIGNGVQPMMQVLGGSAPQLVNQLAGGLSAAPLAVGAVQWDAQTGLVADLTGAASATINAFREALAIQELLERDARGGTRYVEILRAHFKVSSPDFRLQRPEYLGGGSAPVAVHPVARTTAVGTGAVFPAVGTLGAFGTHEARSIGFSKSFVEHGVIIGLASVRADLRYQQGLHRSWSRQDRYDFYWPELANLGEQEVLSREIYMDGSAGDTDIFGYQERWAEYRYRPSMITGRMRSTSVATLDLWHLAQEFGARPLLNAAFIEENPPFDRIQSIPTENDFFGDFYFRLVSARPMPTYSVPGLGSRF